MLLHSSKSSILLTALLMLSACSNGGGDSSGDGSSGADNSGDSQPSLQLNDGDVLGDGSSVIRIPAGGDSAVARVSSAIVRQGNLPECSGRYVDESLVANSLIEACLLDQPGCAVSFQPLSDLIEVIPPPLFAPVGIEYDVSLVGRNGSIADPVRAVFCFDVGINAPPVTTPDTFQLNYPSVIDRSGVRYGERCQKVDGSQGVLANDDDDEHITNTCLRAELVVPPVYASNDFSSTFGADGSFVYEAFNDLPPENSDGVQQDTFTYKVTDGVNGFSDPVQVIIVFADSANTAPLASDDTYSIPEDSAVQILAVLNNDSDPDALPLSVAAVSNGPGNGSATIRNGTVIEYRPNPGFVGQDSFSYTAQDSGGLTVTANVTINITNVNDTPLAANDSTSTNENTPVVVTVLANDSDADNDSIRVVSVSNPNNGAAAVSSGNAITYTPDAGYFGRDSFEYTITDGNATATATVVVQVISVNVAPVVAADELSVDEGGSVVVNLLQNDSDADNDTLRIVSVTSPSNGTATLLDDGNVRYTGNGGFNGNDTFSYTVTDGSVEAVGRVSVVVNSINDSPVASNDSVATTEDTAVTIDVLANDSDPEGDNLTVSSITDTTAGTAVINADNTVTFTPDTSFSGQAGFSYAIDDGNGGSDTANVSVAVSDTNENPIAGDDTRTTEQDDPVGIQVLENDSDPDGDALTLSVATPPANGTASVTARGDVIVYSPASGFSGTDSFTYQISDGNGGSAVATVMITVSNSNVPPTAAPDTAQVAQGGTVSIDVLGNDSDPDGDALTVSLESPPDDGSAVLQANGIIAYTPDATFAGVDTLVYSIADGNGGTASATVTITVDAVIVNNPPVAEDDDAQVTQGRAVNFNILANDSDPDSDSLTVSIVTPPENGVATVLADNRIRYRSSAAFVGADSIVYQVDDGNGATDTATVSIAVSSNNAAPVAVDDSSATTESQVVSIDVIANDSDTDNDALTITAVSAAANGVTDIVAGQVSYAPDAGFSGTDSFTYTVADGNGGDATAAVTVTVSAVNGLPVAVDDSAATPQAQLVSIDVIANDSDADGDTLTLTAVSPAANGVTDIVAGQATYTSAPGFAGTDTFTYEISDGNGGDSTATVTVTVSATNTPPVAVSDAVVTDQDVAIDIVVLANDSDADGDALLVSIDTAPADGTALVAADNSINYQPDAGFFGTDSLVYEITDGNATDIATVSITVTEVVANQAPLAVDDSVDTDQEVPVQIAVLANDTDPEGDVLTVDTVSTPLNGAVTADAAGVLTYTPDTGFSGTEVFGYGISDANGAPGSATVTVTVNAVVTNSLPLAVNDEATTTEDTPVIVAVLANDSDIDGDLLVVSAIGSGANGTTLLNTDGSIEYTPASGFSGLDAFDYTIDDGVSGTATASVDITVNAAVTAPVVPPTAAATMPGANDKSTVFSVAAFDL